MTDLALGIVGLGNWGDRLAHAVAAVPGATLQMCYARTPDTRNDFAQRHGCQPATAMEALLAEPLDGILVATPHSTHREVVTTIVAANVAAINTLKFDSSRPETITTSGK